MWNIETWKMNNSSLISKQNAAISPTKSYMRWLMLNKLSNTSGLLRNPQWVLWISKPTFLKCWFRMRFWHYLVLKKIWWIKAIKAPFHLAQLKWLIIISGLSMSILRMGNKLVFSQIVRAIYCLPSGFWMG